MKKSRALKNKNGRPFLGAGLEGNELKNYLFNHKVDRRIVIKMTEKEFEDLMKKYNSIKAILNIDRSSYIKKIIFEEDISKLINQKNNSELIKKLNRIGVNINQAVKKINSFNTKDQKTNKQIENLQSFMDRVMYLLDQLLF